MPDTLRVLPFGSHQCLGGKGEMKELFKMAQPVSSDWQKEDSNQVCPRPHTPASTTLPPATEGRATGRKRIRTRRVHARTHPLPPPCLPQRKAERLAERGFEPGVSTPARTRFHHPASRNGRQSNWQKEDSNPAVSTPARTHFHHPASRNGRQSTHAKANITRTFLHVLFIHKNDTNWLVL